jgi:hypothetical protein
MAPFGIAKAPSAAERFVQIDDREQLIALSLCESVFSWKEQLFRIQQARRKRKTTILCDCDCSQRNPLCVLAASDMLYNSPSTCRGPQISYSMYVQFPIIASTTLLLKS